METSGFLLVILLGITVMAISFLLDRVWAAAMPVRWIYLVIRAPGVILHECAHILGCLLTGAQIRHVVLFSRDGGSVTYTRPLLPYLGDVIISTAPVFVLPLVLSFLTWIFGMYLGCSFPTFPSTIVSADTLILLGEGIIGTFRNNLLTQFNGWFLLYLYLTLSLVLSAAPSGQDMKNAAAGILLIALAGILVFWSDIPIAQEILTGFMYLLGTGFTLGLVYGFIALLLSSPLILWYGYTRSS
jgi:hypothetical protein